MLRKGALAAAEKGLLQLQTKSLFEPQYNLTSTNAPAIVSHKASVNLQKQRQESDLIKLFIAHDKFIWMDASELSVYFALPQGWLFSEDFEICTDIRVLRRGTCKASPIFASTHIIRNRDSVCKYNLLLGSDVASCGVSLYFMKTVRQVKRLLGLVVQLTRKRSCGGSNPPSVG